MCLSYFLVFIHQTFQYTCTTWFYMSSNVSTDGSVLIDNINRYSLNMFIFIKLESLTQTKIKTGFFFLVSLKLSWIYCILKYSIEIQHGSPHHLLPPVILSYDAPSEFFHCIPLRPSFYLHYEFFLSYNCVHCYFLIL